MSIKREDWGDGSGRAAEPETKALIAEQKSPIAKGREDWGESREVVPAHRQQRTGISSNARGKGKLAPAGEGSAWGFHHSSGPVVPSLGTPQDDMLTSLPEAWGLMSPAMKQNAMGHVYAITENLEPAPRAEAISLFQSLSDPVQGAILMSFGETQYDVRPMTDDEVVDLVGDDPVGVELTLWWQEDGQDARQNWARVASRLRDIRKGLSDDGVDELFEFFGDLPSSAQMATMCTLAYRE